ncbi:RxLR effector protein [Phytophthora megakarya]|uniref:RxLR effector protein n=1 Tax=Phytophthora megakarya TaxID=4795 RepID=A0A225WBC3_9STRA|nr:RxLR effector protein [Phytophthora megakarya]
MHLYLVARLILVVLLVNVELATSFEFTTANYTTATRFFASHEKGVAPKRFLRSYDERAEARAIGGGTISDLPTHITDPASKIAQKIRSSENYKAELVAKYILTNSELTELTKQINRLNTKKVTLIGTLADRYGDNALAMALVSAEKNADSILAPQIKELQKEQLMRWSDRDLSTGGVFKLLKMDDEGYQMLRGDKFNILDDYSRHINSKEHEGYLLDGLRVGMGGQQNLWTFLQTAKTHPSTMVKAQQLEASLITQWMREGWPPIDVFQSLKFDEVNNAFNADNLKMFVKYVDDFNVKYRANTEPAIDIYTRKFGDTVVTMKLLSAMKVPTTKEVATRLYNQKLEGWVNRGNVGTLISQLGGQLLLSSEKATKNAETTQLHKLIFASWVKKDITPDEVLSRVFLKGSGTAITAEQKKIVDKFTRFYASLE